MDEAGNREQGPALREWGGHKVGSTSLGTGEWARKAWEPKSLRGKKVTSSEGWTPAPAQYHQPLGREWPRSFLKCLCIIASTMAIPHSNTQASGQGTGGGQSLLAW